MKQITKGKSQKSLIGEHATVSTVVDGKIEQKKGKLLKFKEEPAVVRVSMGTTLNMGNYQSLRLGVDLALPCSPAEVDQAFERASKFTEKKLTELVARHKQPENEEVVDMEL